MKSHSTPNEIQDIVMKFATVALKEIIEGIAS